MPAHAATLTVINTNDNGPGSLRQGLTTANDGDTINFTVTGTITLTGGGLPINKNITISGPGADQLSIDGSQAVVVLGIFPDKTAAISGLTIRNGLVGIWIQGTLSVSNCTIRLNSIGGILNDHSTLLVSNCVISNNSEYGIDNNGFSFLSSNDHLVRIAAATIENSIISDNSGPGVTNTGELTILDSTISGNSAGSTNYGGGISSGTFKAPGIVIISNTTISDNSAPEGGGGGIEIEYGGLIIVNSTVSGNSARDNGGGIDNLEGSVLVANSTIVGNSAKFGGGVYNVGQQGLGTLETGNTVFDAGSSGENIFNNGGFVGSDGYNLCSDDGGGLLNSPGDQINTDPLLAPLQDNGGPTFTHLPLPGSPAIDAGDPSFTRPPFHDQRGSCFYRVFGRRIDVGSVETQPRPRCATPAPRPTP
jgi:hypothetical protein